MATLKQRREFWETLKNFDGKNYAEEVKTISEMVNKLSPIKLCRYRSVSPNNLESLRTNKLEFSTSDYYDDPFDTFLHIDTSVIRREIKSAMTNPHTFEMLAFLKEKYGLSIPNEILTKITSDTNFEFAFNNAKDYIQKNVRNVMRKTMQSICFSENEYNETLWLKYANDHKGFVQVYDMNNTDALICGTLPDCTKCPMGDKSFYFYPVHYSNTKYDATNFAKWYAAVLMLNQIAAQGVISESTVNDMIKHFPPNIWEREKITLIKKHCHHYDEEWRLLTAKINQNPDNSKLYIKWIPYKIILGLNMTESDKSLVASIALQAGIKEVTEMYINDNDNLADKEYKR